MSQENLNIQALEIEEGQLIITGIKTSEQLTAEGKLKSDGTPYTPGYSHLMLVTNRPGATEAGRNSFFYDGKQGTSKAVCFKTFSTSRVEELELSIGDDLNAVLPEPATVQITEIEQSTFTAWAQKDPNLVKGFKAKINPATKQNVLSENNEVIYMKSEFAWADECVNTLVPSVKKVKELAI